MTVTPTAPAAARRQINKNTLYFFGALGGILFGYDLGVISGVLVLISKQWTLSGFDKGVVTASLSVGAMVGAGLAARLNNAIGRRRSIMMAAGIVIAGTVACSLAPDYPTLTVFRFVLGVGIGFSSATVPTFLAELAPSRLRGAMSALNQIFIVLGILIAFLVDYWLAPTGDGSWRWMFAGAIVPAAILLVGMTFLPETPRWLINLGKEEEARQCSRPRFSPAPPCWRTCRRKPSRISHRRRAGAAIVAARSSSTRATPAIRCTS